MSRVYIYVVERDFGFAPNPFHGYCSLATCKPRIRNKAQIGDWVFGMGGGRLAATGRCVYAMRITSKITFNEYRSHPAYLDKKPIRNGSRKMMVGDNIYHFDPTSQRWQQADSHHSNADGSVNLHNLNVDTRTDKVLLSDHFYYFGSQAPAVPSHLLSSVGYKNGRNHRAFELNACADLIDWLERSFGKSLNMIAGDPFDFDESEKRYSVKGNKIS
jgi:hypothetical protein